jgi:hypothetical protein
MRLPWRKPKPAPDVDAIVREACGRTAELVAREVAGEMARFIASSPMPGPPNPGSTSPMGIYAMDNPIVYSTPQAPTRRPGSVVDTRTLRNLAATYDILRDCIQHIKREVDAVPTQFVPKDEKDDSQSTKREIAQAEEFFSKQGGIGGIGKLRSEFEGEVIEDLSVLGVAALFYHPTRGGWPYQVISIPSDTIRPRIDAWGWPGPGEEWYEQWVLGVKVAGFTRDQITFRGLSTQTRNDSPFPVSPVEWLIHVVNSALRADQWNREWLVHGNVPDELYGAPESWTPAQIMEYAIYFDAMLAGNTEARRKAKIVPGGLKSIRLQTRKDADFQEFELWLMRRTCAVMGVQPASIGFAGEQYKVSQEGSMDSTSAFGVGTYLAWRAAEYDDVLDRLDLKNVRTKNVTAREEKATERAERNSTLLNGIKTPNEARSEEGLDPIEGGDTLFIPTLLRPLDQALEPPAPPMAPGANPQNPANPAAPTKGKKGAKTEQRAHLLAWERKALNRFRSRGTADTAFASDAISAEARARIEGGLSACQSPAEVRRVFHVEFARAESSNPEPLDGDDDDADSWPAWAGRMTAELEALHATSA